ncbi:MAG: hypothetical protein ACO1SV_23145 [Fimbriimonas sp.]
MRYRRERGGALTMALISMFFVLTIGLGLAALTLHNVRLTRRDRQVENAFNIAESGAERAARWLKDQTTGIYSITTRDPFGGNVSFGGGTYQVTITAFAEDATAALKRFRIISTGTFGNQTEQVEVVTRQQSFGMYAYFTDRETSSMSTSGIWFASFDRIRGPAHSNNANSSDFQINWANTTAPIFEGQLTSVSNQIDYSPSRPSTETQFQKVYRAGSRGYQLGVDPIPLPASSDMQRDAAWGASTGFPTTNGVYTRTNGGIYIRGDSSIVMSVGTGGVQVIRVTQGSTVTTITFNQTTKVMTRQVGTGTITTTTGANGVIYSANDITGLSGTIADNVLGGTGNSEIVARNSMTIAADVNAGRTITVNNTLRHNSQIDFSQSMDAVVNKRAGILGLIGRNVRVATGAPTAMQIDAVILAGSSSNSDGSFFVQDYNTKSPTGTLRITGGIIQKARGPVGTLSGNLIGTGYAKDYYYDSRIAENPPPYFPITPNYDRISWRRL